MPSIKYIAALIALLSAPALAGLKNSGVKNFYVLSESTLGVCEITTEKPRTWGRTVLGDLAFGDMVAAEALARRYCSSILAPLKQSSTRRTAGEVSALHRPRRGLEPA
jgi:hypothetical protein